MQLFTSISGNPVTTATSIRGPNINRPLLAVPKAAGGPNVNLAVMNKVKKHNILIDFNILFNQFNLIFSLRKSKFTVSYKLFSVLNLCPQAQYCNYRVYHNEK